MLWFRTQAHFYSFCLPQCPRAYSHPPLCNEASLVLAPSLPQVSCQSLTVNWSSKCSLFQCSPEKPSSNLTLLQCTNNARWAHFYCYCKSVLFTRSLSDRVVSLDVRVLPSDESGQHFRLFQLEVESLPLPRFFDSFCLAISARRSWRGEGQIPNSWMFDFV